MKSQRNTFFGYSSRDTAERTIRMCEARRRPHLLIKKIDRFAPDEKITVDRHSCVGRFDGNPVVADTAFHFEASCG